MTAGQLSTLTRLTTPTVSKVMKLLHRRQLVSSTRGLHGGYRLARPAADITAVAPTPRNSDSPAHVRGVHGARPALYSTAMALTTGARLL